MSYENKLTLLANSKEALRVKLGLSESLPLSEYYKYSYRFDPMTLFTGGKQGVWFDPSDLSTLYQDVAGTVPVNKDGDPVALMRDKSGNGNHAVQSVSAARPTYKTDGFLHWIEFDGADDILSVVNNTGQMPQPYGIYLAIQQLVRTNYDFYYDSVLPQATMYTHVNVIKTAHGSAVATRYSVKSYDKFVVTERTDNGVSEIVFNSSEPAMASTGTYVIKDFSVGGRLNSTFRTNMNLYGMIMVGSYSSDSDRDGVDVYLRNKSGVTL